MKNIFVFIPDKLNLRSCQNETGYLKGVYKNSSNFEAYYITDYKIHPSKPKLNCIAFIGSDVNNKLKGSNTFIYDSQKQDLIFRNKYTADNTLLEVIYDYAAFKNLNPKTSNIQSYGEPFLLLAEYVKNSDCSNGKNGHGFLLNRFLPVVILILDLILRVLDRCKTFISYSSLLCQLKDSTLTFRDTLVDIKSEKEITAKSANIIFAKCLDLVAGVCLFYFLLEYKSIVAETVLDSIEIIIINLKELLHYLMGAPIGLKLNYAFNISLARFFFYHISLWRIFLYGIQPLFVQYFKILVLPLTLGLSFQIAMLSDIISVATFHVYCIYVYAARLFYLQLRGLKSLWRLFIGRKYNPLRERVDSCEYSQHQLFIGTLAFTVLLFLLPTTMLYYTVFTMLRLVILALDGLFCNLRYFLKHLPVYILILWIWNPRSVSGVMYYNFIEAKDNVVWLETNFHALSLFASLKKYIPENSNGQSLGLTAALPKIFTGVLL